MDEILLQLGVGGALACLLIGLVLNFLLKWRESQSKAEAAGPQLSSSSSTNTYSNLNGATTRVLAQLDNINKVLDARDADGTPLVYVPRSLGTAIEELAESVKEQNTLLNQVVVQLTLLRNATPQKESKLQ